MNLYVGITDYEWFKFLSMLPSVDEVNFWQPGGRTNFKALQPGELMHAASTAKGPPPDMATVVTCLMSSCRHASWKGYLKLPSWTPATVSVWPPYRPLDPAMITPVVGGDSRLHSSRWYEVWQEEQQRRARSAAE